MELISPRYALRDQRFALSKFAPGKFVTAKAWMIILAQLTTCLICADPCLSRRRPHCVIGVAPAFVASCPLVIAISVCHPHRQLGVDTR